MLGKAYSNDEALATKDLFKALLPMNITTHIAGRIADIWDPEASLMDRFHAAKQVMRMITYLERKSWEWSKAQEEAKFLLGSFKAEVLKIYGSVGVEEGAKILLADAMLMGKEKPRVDDICFWMRTCFGVEDVVPTVIQKRSCSAGYYPHNVWPELPF